MSIEQLDLVVGELVEAAVDDALERGALVLARPSAHSASSSSRSAQREATGWPSPSEWVRDSVVEKPEAAGLDRLVQQLGTIASSCSGVASLPTASAPIT